MLKIEERAEKFAYGYVEGFDPTDEKRGLMCTAHVCGQNEMLDAIKKEHELVRIQDLQGQSMPMMKSSLISNFERLLTKMYNR